MSKYIDLASRLHADTRDSVYLDEAREVLNWLDSHPDQVPGLTRTASEFDEAVESCITEDGTVPPHKFAERLGVVCVPDPEPTNAEKWVKFCSSKMGLDLDPWQANVLDKAGMKAPEADGE